MPAMTPFKPGHSIRGGRPVGARNRFSHAFITDFLADWEKHGAKAIQSVRMLDPGTYLRVAASIIPRELMVEPVTSGLSAEERSEMIAALKQHLLTVRQGQPMLIEAKANEPATN
jgi:hypothetical protein